MNVSPGTRTRERVVSVLPVERHGRERRSLSGCPLLLEIPGVLDPVRPCLNLLPVLVVPRIKVLPVEPLERLVHRVIDALEVVFPSK